MAEPITRRYTLVSWLFGLVADLILFALFLLLGLTVLNVLIQAIVLVVGIATAGETKYRVEETVTGIEIIPITVEDRRNEDLVDLGIAGASLIGVGAAYWVYRRTRKKYIHLFGDPGFELFVSKRYLIAREGGRLVTLITTISVLGVAVGVMALIVVISVMEGFDQTLVRKFMGVFSHIQIAPHPRLSESKVIPVEMEERILGYLDNQDFVVAAAPIYEHRTLLMQKPGSFDRVAYSQIRGIDPEREKNVTEFLSYVDKGNSVPGDNEIILGESLANRLNADIGDTIYAIGKIAPTANRIATRTQPLKVVGTFHSGLYDVDDGFAFTNLATMRGMLVVEGGVTAIHVKVTDPDNVEPYLAEIYKEIPRTYWAYSWQQLNPQFFEALWMEKVAMFIILLLIVLVASFNIVGTLVMTVVQKTRDIGVLKSMGATRLGIMTIFLLHGSLVGLLGTSLGVVWGVRICRFVDKDIDKIFQLPGGVYGIDRLPVVVDPWLIAYMVVCAMFICIVASIIPALQAARLNPVEALRYD